MKLNECSCGCGGMSDDCTSNQKEQENYMFFGNLETIKRAVDALLQMDPQKVDAILKDGHNWAADHIATSKDDIEEVAGFLMNRMGENQMMSQPNEKSMGYVQTFESFVKKYGEKITLEEFKKIKKNTKIVYLGTPYTVVKNDDSVLHLKSEKSGHEKTVNLGMFNHGGVITE